MLTALLAAGAIALTSLMGALFFGNTKHLVGIQKFVVPMAVGVFLSLTFTELVPETLAAAPTYGAAVIMLGFIGFYILAAVLHKRFHHLAAEDCDRKGGATLLLVGDGIHNVADGIILGGAFMLDPAIGAATALALALHEIPQEIVEFGVLIRAGYSRGRAALLNLLSASSIILGVGIIVIFSAHAANYIWILTGIAAGNLLYLAASDLLPRIHGNLANYRSIRHSSAAIILGFILMTVMLHWTHANLGATTHTDHAEEHEDEHIH